MGLRASLTGSEIWAPFSVAVLYGGNMGLDFKSGAHTTWRSTIYTIYHISYTMYHGLYTLHNVWSAVFWALHGGPGYL